MNGALGLKLLTLTIVSQVVRGSEGIGSKRTLITSIGDLQLKIYTERKDATACVRLLNVDGPVGCSSPQVSAPLQHIDDLGKVDDGPRIVLVPSGKASDFLKRLSTDEALQRRVAGVFVGHEIPDADSPDDTFPQAGFMPYKDHHHKWNPEGRGVLTLDFSVPILLLDNTTGPEALSRAAGNAAQGFSGKLHYATLDSPMSAKVDSHRCLADQTCVPLGGHSVWAALPPLPVAASSEGAAALPTTLVLASIDGSGLFHDVVKGADAPLSGLIAMLAAAEILGNSSDAASFNRRLVFAALAGEPWGFMGSKRLLWEMHTGQASAQGLSLSNIDQVVEVGQVGRAVPPSGGDPRLFVHAQRTPGFASAENLTNALIGAGKAGLAQVEESSGSLPGIPPSSLSSFLRANASIAGVVLTEFNAAFTNPYYNSRFDNAVQQQGLVAAAIVVARALHSIAVNGTGINPLKVDEEAVKVTVSELVACLIADTPGLDCGLARGLTTIVGGPIQSGYIGILRTLTEDSQEPDQVIKSDISRFIWNFLALRTASGPAGFRNPTGDSPSGPSGSANPTQSTGSQETDKAPGCDPYERVCEEGAVCVGWRSDAKPGPRNGQCLTATARFVPSYSTSLVCKDCKGQDTFWDFNWELTNASDAWAEAVGWPPDPMWAESNWQEGVPSFRMFLREPEGAGRRVLSAGVCITLVAGFCAAAVHLLGRRTHVVVV